MWAGTDLWGFAADPRVQTYVLLADGLATHLSSRDPSSDFAACVSVRGRWTASDADVHGIGKTCRDGEQTDPGCPLERACQQSTPGKHLPALMTRHTDPRLRYVKPPPSSGQG